MKRIEQDDVEAGGWSIIRGVLILHTFDSKGSRKEILRLPLWHPLTGEWLVPLEEENASRRPVRRPQLPRCGSIGATLCGWRHPG